MRLWTRPTVTVEFDRPSHFNLLRGCRRRQCADGKLAANTKLQAAGLPVPDFAVITPATRLDPVTWGPYVVVKPNTGGRSAYVRIQRTGRVRYKPPAELPADYPGRNGPMFAERFIYTGPWPVAYRVLTLFGEPLLCLRHEGTHDQPALSGPTAFRENAGGNIVAAAMGGTIGFHRENDLLDLARRVHAVFPDIPLLGQDIVREVPSGKLFVLETNPNGSTWAFTNRSGRQMQADFGLDFYRQFDALATAARVLTEVARQRAR